jgi:hypothetical protein
MGRSIVIILLILVILVSIHPQAQARITAAWEKMRPAVVASMDNLYASIRTIVAGNGSHNRTNESPVSPGLNFDVIITMKSRLPL